jgi:hypothetical protein
LVTFVKTHYPNIKYRVWEVISGENTGSYVTVMGPMSFKDMDTPMVSPKGEALQKADGQALDALCNSTQSMYMRKQEDISKMKAERKLKYLIATYTDFNPGTWDDIHDIIKKRKESRDKGESKLDIDYFRPAASGNNNAYMSARFFEKMEELDIQEDLGAMYDKVFGKDAGYKIAVDFNGMIKSSKSEMRVLRADLSAL